MKNILGKSWQTTLGGIMTVIGILPSALHYFDVIFPPEWLEKTSALCAGLSFIYLAFMAKSKTVTGVGENSQTLKEIKNEEK